MEKNSSISNFKKTNHSIPKAFVLFLVLWVSTECFIYGFFLNHSTNPTNIKFREKIFAARDQENTVDILIIGDSSAGAINAAQFENLTGMKSFNYSLTGNATIAGNYLILKEYLHNKKPPKAIIMMNVYDIWGRGPHNARVAHALMSTYPKIITETNWIKAFPTRLEDIANVIKTISENMIPSRIYFHDIKRFLDDPLENIKDSSTQASRVRKGINQTKGSSFYDKEFKQQFEKDVKYHKRFIKINEFKVSNWNRYYLEKIIETAKDNNIEIFITYSPFYSDLYYELSESKHLLAYKSFISEIAASHDHISLLNDSFYLVEADKLSVIDHVISSEAKLLTEVISRKVIEVLY